MKLFCFITKFKHVGKKKKKKKNGMRWFFL